MTYLGIKTEQDVTTVYYKATWDYDFGYMLLFLQQVIDEDFESGFTYAVTGNYDQTVDFLEELQRCKGKLRHCRSLLRPRNYISLAGYSKSMDCDLRLTLWSGTRQVQLEVMGKQALFTENGDHVFDVYMDSFEILGYMAAAQPPANAAQ